MEIIPVRPSDVRATIQTSLSKLIQFIDAHLNNFDHLKKNFRSIDEYEVYDVIFSKDTTVEQLTEDTCKMLANHYLNYGWLKVTYTTVKPKGSEEFDRMQFSFYM